METKTIASPIKSLLPETVAPEPARPSENDALRDVQKEIGADCRVEPEKYLEEVRVAAGGE